MKPSFWFGAALAAFFIFRGKAQAATIDAETGAELQPDLPIAEFKNAPYGADSGAVLPDLAYQDTYTGEIMHFTLEEFTASKTATARGIDNQLPGDLYVNAQATLDMLERIRAYLSDVAQTDVPIIIQSGYRSPALNAAVGGAARSDHLQAMAADWTAPTFGTSAEVAAILEPVVYELGIGQLINEFPGPKGWIHTSTQVPDNLNNRIITITSQGVTQGIT